KYMGLKSPLSTLQMPKDYINGLKAMNGGRPALSGDVTREAAASTPSSGTQQTSAAPTSAAPKANGSRSRAASSNARPQHAAARAPELTAPAAPSFAAVQ